MITSALISHILEPELANIIHPPNNWFPGNKSPVRDPMMPFPAPAYWVSYPGQRAGPEFLFGNDLQAFQEAGAIHALSPCVRRHLRPHDFSTMIRSLLDVPHREFHFHVFFLHRTKILAPNTCLNSSIKPSHSLFGVRSAPMNFELTDGVWGILACNRSGWDRDGCEIEWGLSSRHFATTWEKIETFLLSSLWTKFPIHYRWIHCIFFSCHTVMPSSAPSISPSDSCLPSVSFIQRPGCPSEHALICLSRDEHGM